MHHVGNFHHTKYFGLEFINEVFERSYEFLSYLDELEELVKKDKIDLDRVSQILVDIDITLKTQIIDKYQDVSEYYHRYIGMIIAGEEKLKRPE